MDTTISTRRALARQIEALGVVSGDMVMVHAGLRSLGRLLGGPDALIGALRDVLGPSGTLMAYTDWQQDFGGDPYDDTVPPHLRDDIQPFDPAASRAIRDNGALPELIRTTPGALRSASPGPSCTAIGAMAEWLLADHALDYGYGPQSPFARLVEGAGKVLMLGCPLDTMTILHHAEHLAAIPDKRIKRYPAPFRVDGALVWLELEEFDTGDPVVEGLPDDYFATIVTDFLATGAGATGKVGDATATLVRADQVVPFAVRWLETRFAPRGGNPSANDALRP